MVVYFRTKKDISISVRDLIIYNFKSLIIIGIITLIEAPISFLYGYLGNLEHLKNGFISLFITLFVAILCLVFYIKIKKRIMREFSKSNLDGNMEYNFTDFGESFEIHNVTNNKKVWYYKRDIRNLHKAKKTIIIEMFSKDIILLPNMEEILKSF